MEPVFEDQYCGDCPFLVPHPTDPYGIFRCKKYDVELDYYDGILQAEKCYQEYVDPDWVIAGE